MDEDRRCQGPYMARRLYRLANLLASGGFDEASVLVGAAAISVCETAPRHRLIDGVPCLCSLSGRPFAAERHLTRR
jgi:hypothetical protein